MPCSDVDCQFAVRLATSNAWPLPASSLVHCGQVCFQSLLRYGYLTPSPLSRFTHLCPWHPYTSLITFYTSSTVYLYAKSVLTYPLHDVVSSYPLPRAQTLPQFILLRAVALITEFQHRRLRRQLSLSLSHAQRTLAPAKSSRLHISTHLPKGRLLRPNNGIHRLPLRQQSSAPVAPRPHRLYRDDKQHIHNATHI